MKTTYASPQRFLVTTPGLSATRWLCFVLASHRDVFVAHGKHPLDSIYRSEFLREKQIDDEESMTQGNLMAPFYTESSLAEMFAKYHELLPAARALGNVHTFTIEALMAKTGEPEELAGINIVNLLRHPVRYLASHTALVGTAEKYPLYRHYAEVMFPDALRRFPELLLLECPDYRRFVAFAVSCLSVCNLANDFRFPQFDAAKMETLTTDVDSLQALCERLTGLSYSRDRLREFIQLGAINSHRKSKAGSDAAEGFESWPRWQQDMARMMIPEEVLTAFERHGYDIDMLRVGSPVAKNRLPVDATSHAPTLADELRRQNPQHPWLEAAPAQTSPFGSLNITPELLEENFRGYNFVRLGARCFALAQSLGPFDLAQAPPELLDAHRQSGACLVGNSVAELKRRLTAKPISLDIPRAAPSRPAKNHKTPVNA